VTRPHIHESACELRGLADKKRFPRDSRFGQETRIRKREPPPLDATGSAGPAQPAPASAAATVLLGIPGLLVTAATVTEDGQTLTEVITDPAVEAPRCCPRCGEAATRVKEHPRTAPRDMYLGDRQVLLAWHKTRWHCDTAGCGQGTFTERLPAVRRRARLTSRLRTRLGQAVGDDLMPAAAAARRYRVCDRTAARAFTAYADEQLADLDEQQDPVHAAGVDEFRRGPPAHGADPGTGEVSSPQERLTATRPPRQANPAERSRNDKSCWRVRPRPAPCRRKLGGRAWPRPGRPAGGAAGNGWRGKWPLPGPSDPN